MYSHQGYISTMTIPVSLRRYHPWRIAPNTIIRQLQKPARYVEMALCCHSIIITFVKGVQTNAQESSHIASSATHTRLRIAI